MNFPEFAKFQERLFAECSAMCHTKGREYSNSEDRFGNFNRLAERLGIKREQVLYVYLTKHLDGIESRIVRGHVLSNESTRGRIVDAITYLSLLAGMLEEGEKVAGGWESVQQNIKRRVDALSPEALAELLSLMPEIEDFHKETHAHTAA